MKVHSSFHSELITSYTGSNFYKYNMDDQNYKNIKQSPPHLIQVKTSCIKTPSYYYNLKIRCMKYINSNPKFISNQCSYINNIKYISNETSINSLRYSANKNNIYKTYSPNDELLQSTKQYQTKQNELPTYSIHLEEQNKKINELTHILKQLQEENEKIKNNNCINEHNEQELVNENDSLKKKIDELEKEKELLKENKVKLNEQIENKLQNINVLDDQIKQLNEEICKKDEEINLLKKELNEMQIDKENIINNYKLESKAELNENLFANNYLTNEDNKNGDINTNEQNHNKEMFEKEVENDKQSQSNKNEKNSEKEENGDILIENQNVNNEIINNKQQEIQSQEFILFETFQQITDNENLVPNLVLSTNNLPNENENINN